MVIDIDSQHQAFAGILGKAPNSVKPLTSSAPEADAARRAQNISVWSSYLPQDCVQSMITMGWHDST
jgi:hypothetical protein